MSKLRVERWDHDGAGEPDLAALRAKLEALGYATTRYDYPPGTHFPPHVHAVSKCDAVVAGRFEIRSGADAWVLEPGDLAFVPAGAEHEATVLGDETVVSLDGIARS